MSSSSLNRKQWRICAQVFILFDHKHCVFFFRTLLSCQLHYKIVLHIFMAHITISSLDFSSFFFSSFSSPNVFCITACDLVNLQLIDTIFVSSAPLRWPFVSFCMSFSLFLSTQSQCCLSTTLRSVPYFFSLVFQ